MKRKQITDTTAETLFNKNYEHTISKGITRPNRNFNNSTYTIYNIHTLSDLIEFAFPRKKMSAQQRGKKVSNKIKLRFLLTVKGEDQLKNPIKNFELLFGEEGDPTSIIPPHYVLTGVKTAEAARCYVAGNVTFNLIFDEESKLIDYEIMKISNKSGDFKPCFDSLQLALGVMFTNNLKFSKQLLIEQHNVKSAIHKYSLVTSEVKRFIEPLFTEAQKFEFVENNKKLVKRTYETIFQSTASNPRRDFFQKSGIKPRTARPLFLDAVDVNVDPNVEEAAVAAVSPKTQSSAKSTVPDILEENIAKILKS